MKSKNSTNNLTFNLILIVLLIIALCVTSALLIYLIKKQIKRLNYDELTYYDFNISYDDDNYCYEIFTEDKMYTIRESQLDIKYDSDETYIVIFDNNYDWFYNKAILVIGVKGNEK